MKDTIARLQQDILNPAIPLSNVLMIAKVLAYQLRNDEFKQWVKSELDGYDKAESVPAYRVLSVMSTFNYGNRFVSAKHISLPLELMELPSELVEAANKIILMDGVQTLQQFAESSESINYRWPGTWVAILNDKLREMGESIECYTGNRPVSPSVIAQVITTIRSKLQDFILELNEVDWPLDTVLLPQEKVQHLFQVTIDNKVEGGRVATFDQRNQHVAYQYNAAGNINFGSVQDQMDLASELQKLKAEITKAGEANVIDAEIAEDTNHQLSKAIIEAKKPAPDKKTFLDYVNSAKDFIKEVTALSGVVLALQQASQAAQKLL